MPSKNGKRWIRRALAFAVVSGLGLALAAAYRPRPVDVECRAVERAELQVVVDEEGRTRIRDRFTLSAPVQGVLERIELDEGDRVQAGQVVARIFPSVEPLLDARTRSSAKARVLAARAAIQRAEAAAVQARADAKLARREQERRHELYEADILSESEFDRLKAQTEAAEARREAAEFAVRVAEHELAMAEAALRQTRGRDRAGPLTIEAPIDGVVLELFHESEVSVRAGERLLQLGDPRNLEVVVDVLTQDAVRIRPGQPVEFVRWGGDRPLGGRVRRVEPAAFTEISALGVEEQRVHVVIDLSAEGFEAEALGHGFRVEARIVVERIEDAVQVPEGALFRFEDRWALFRLEGDRARRVAVQTGVAAERTRQILAGVEPGDRVLVYPSDLVEDGTKVACDAP